MLFSLFFFFPLSFGEKKVRFGFFLHAYLSNGYPYLFVVNVAAVFSLSCVCPTTQVMMIRQVYMLVHYCGAPGACNNNEAKKICLPPFSSHPLYPELRGLAAVLRGCCSFFSSSCSPHSLCFSGHPSLCNLSPGSEQTEPAPSLSWAGQGSCRAPELPHFLFFSPFSLCMMKY